MLPFSFSCLLPEENTTRGTTQSNKGNRLWFVLERVLKFQNLVCFWFGWKLSMLALPAKGQSSTGCPAPHGHSWGAGQPTPEELQAGKPKSQCHMGTLHSSQELEPSPQQLLRCVAEAEGAESSSEQLAGNRGARWAAARADRTSKAQPFFISLRFKPRCPWVLLWSLQISTLPSKHFCPALAEAPDHRFHESCMPVPIRLLCESPLLRASHCWDAGLIPQAAMCSGLEPSGFHTKNNQEINSSTLWDLRSSLFLKTWGKRKTLYLHEFTIFKFLVLILLFLENKKILIILCYLGVGGKTTWIINVINASSNYNFITHRHLFLLIFPLTDTITGKHELTTEFDIILHS